MTKCDVETLAEIQEGRMPGVKRSHIDKTLILESNFTTPPRRMKMKIMWVSSCGRWFKGEIKATARKRGKLLKKHIAQWRVVDESKT